MRVLEARYGSMRPWFGNSLSVNEMRKASIWWRDLACMGGDTQLGLVWFNEVVRKRIGNGNTIKFWSDKWIGTETLEVLFPSVMARHSHKEASVAEMGDWFEAGWKWKWSVLGEAAVFSVPTGSSSADSNFPLFVEFLQGVQLSTTDDDRWIWLPDTPRGFTVNSCYIWLSERTMLNDPQTDEQVTNACRSLWKSDLPSKVLVFGWRLLLRKLPTRDKLFSRGIISSLQGAMCVFCQNEVETCDHLFSNCDVVKEVWGGVLSWLNVQQGVEDDVILMFESMGGLIRSKGAKRVKWIFWAATVLQLWLARNSVIFNNKGASVPAIVNSIKFVSWGWFIARRGRSSGLSFSDWFTCPLGCISSL